jgi:Uma2 family endonuclease
MTQALEKTGGVNPQSNPMLDRRHRFTVEEYEKAYFAGAFGDKRVELIEGEVIEMAPMNDPHVDWLGVLTRKLVLALHEVAMVLPQVPVRLEEPCSQPEPDFVVVALSKYEQKKVHVKDAAIVIEVSDSTLEEDRDIKLKLYARNFAKEFWILNVQQQQLEVYRDPEGETYKTKFTLARGEAVTPLEFPGVVLEWWGN